MEGTLRRVSQEFQEVPHPAVIFNMVSGCIALLLITNAETYEEERGDPTLLMDLPRLVGNLRMHLSLRSTVSHETRMSTLRPWFSRQILFECAIQASLKRRGSKFF